MPKTILDHADARSTRAALLALPHGKVFLQQGRTIHLSTDKGGTPAGRERALLSLAEAKVSASRKGMVRAQTIFISIWFTSATAKNGSAKTVTPNQIECGRSLTVKSMLQKSKPPTQLSD
jgi:hypothetical protein